ncbi:MAG: insulinase family protein, partial [Clostridia bacterium]|nr:insulinase family protein [Clostridia bacterium]
YAQLLFSNAFGGTMSSRLFRRIREESGLAYSVYSYPTAYDRSGFITLYAGTGPENAAEVTRIMLAELELVRKEGLSSEELIRAKDQLTASFLMAGESTSARSSAIGRAELSQKKHLTEEEVIDRIASVTMNDVETVLERVCDITDISSCVVGKCGAAEKELRALLG